MLGIIKGSTLIRLEGRWFTSRAGAMSPPKSSARLVRFRQWRLRVDVPGMSRHSTCGAVSPYRLTTDLGVLWFDVLLELSFEAAGPVCSFCFFVSEHGHELF